MNKYSNKSKVGIVGANGYTGLELARLLLNHPHMELSAIFSRQADWQLAFDLPDMKAKTIPHYPLDTSFDTDAHSLDVIFLATPPEVSRELAPLFLLQGVKVIDLSSAFRLLNNSSSPWFHQAHYGLSPWWTSNKSLSTAQLIANPGCYATCALMALLPLLKANLIQAPIIIDAKSGVSGAGRKANTHLLYAELANNFYPYKIGCHSHIPEIAHYFAHFADTDITPLLITHLLPIKRGLSTSIYAELSPKFFDQSEKNMVDQINAAYNTAYQDYPLVRYAHLKENSSSLLSIKHVVGSARTHIGYHVHGKHLLIFAAIDNLLKGAASQAVENFNALYNLPLDTGLQHWEGTL